MLEICFLPVIPQNSFWVSTATVKNSSGFKFSAIVGERIFKWKRISQSQITVPHTNKTDGNKKCSSPYMLKLHPADLLLLLVGAMGLCSSLSMKIRSTHWDIILTCICNQKSPNHSRSHPAFYSAFPFTHCFVVVGKTLGPLQSSESNKGWSSLVSVAASQPLFLRSRILILILLWTVLEQQNFCFDFF